MGQAILDGFERGFGMMERHKARINGEKRYTDSQARLADMDEQNESRYQDTIDHRKAQTENAANHRASMLEQQEQRTSNQQNHYAWQKNVAEEQAQWQLIAPQLQNIHDEYAKTGQLSEQNAKFFKEHQQYNDYNPESYKSPEYRQATKALHDKTTQIFESGKLHQFKDPAYIKSFNDAFKSKIQQGVGEDDLPRNATITSKEVAQLIPTRDGKVSIGLKVTYQPKDGGEPYSEIQPMTKGRTNEEGDPVNEWELKELMSAIGTRRHMAYMAESSEEFRGRSNSTLKSAGVGGATDKKAYRKDLASFEKDLTKAITDIQGDSQYFDEKLRTKAIESVKQTFEQRKKSLNHAYGVEVPEAKTDTNKPKYKSTVDGQDVNGVVDRFMSANKGMTKEQALAAAMKQGYISE